MGYGNPSAQHALGQVAISGEVSLTTPIDERVGVVVVQAAKQRTKFDVWLPACDQLVSKVLLTLSLAHGYRLSWELQKVFVHGSLCLVRARPQSLPVSMRAAVFHYLDLQPALNLAVHNYTEELDEETGLGVALTWFLGVAQYAEAQFLQMMCALEHLVDVYRSTQPTSAVVGKLLFKKKIRPELASKLESMASDEPEFTSSQLAALKRALGNLNRKSAFQGVIDMLDYYGVFYEDIEAYLPKVVGMRNNVVHRGLFKADQSGEDDEVAKLRNVLEELLVRVFLTLLDYRGRYASPLSNLESVELVRC